MKKKDEKKALAPSVLTNGKVQAAAQLLTRLLNCNLPPAVRLRALRMARRLREESDVLNDVRENMARERATKDEEGNPLQQVVKDRPGQNEYVLTDSARAAFQKAYQDFLDSPSELKVDPILLESCLPEDAEDPRAPSMEVLLLLCELGILADPEYQGRPVAE